MSEPLAPHSRVKAERRVLSPDEKWAAEIRERILADCHPFQRDAVLDPSRRVSILAGRGGAKTTTMRARAAIKMTARRRADLLYLAVTEDHARELNWDPMQEMNEHYGLELRFNKSEMAAVCARTGSRYVMGGMEDDADIERYRGKSRDELQVDEAASQNQKLLAKLIQRVVGPRLGDRKGAIVLGGSPGERLGGEFYDATRISGERNARYADRAKPGFTARYWSSHWWNAKMVAELPNAAELYSAIVALWNEALVEKAEQRWSDDNPVWLREYLGLWVADDTDHVFKYRPFRDGVEVKDGVGWNQWDPFGEHPLEGVQALQACIARLAEMGFKNLRYVYGEDMGHTDPFALNLFALSPSDPERRLWHVMGFEQTGMTPRQVAEMHVGEHPERYPDPPGGLMAVTGWPDAMGMDADPATIQTFAIEYGLRFVKAGREANYKQGEIALVNGDFHEGRIKVLKNSHLEQQLEQLQWREDQFGRVKEDPRQPNHSTDTLIQARKLVAGLFESGAVEQEAKPAPATTAHRPPPAPEPSRTADPEGGISLNPLRVPLSFTDPWGNL